MTSRDAELARIATAEAARALLRPDWTADAKRKLRYGWVQAFGDRKWLDLPPEAKDGRRGQR